MTTTAAQNRARARIGEPMTTAHDLAADWSWMDGAAGFRLAGGSVVWEVAEYRHRDDKVRIGRVVVTRGGGVVGRVRYVDPATVVVVLKKPEPEGGPNVP